MTSGDAAREHFMLNEDTGHISMKKSLQLDKQNRGEIDVRNIRACSSEISI